MPIKLNEKAIEHTDVYTVGASKREDALGLPGCASKKKEIHTASTLGQKFGDLGEFYRNLELNADTLSCALRDTNAAKTSIVGVTYLVSDNNGWWTPYPFSEWRL